MWVSEGAAPLLQADEPLHQLEGRPRGVLGLHGAVEERTALVVEHLHVVVAALAPHQLVGIVRGRRDHHEDLARGGFDGHGGPHLAAHELLAEQLQPCVDRAHQVAPRLGQRVVAAVHVGSLHGAVGVDLLDADPLLALEPLLVGQLHAAHARIVARAVRRVALEHVGVDLAYVAQQVAADLARILAHGAEDGVEAREVALVEAQLVLLRYVAGHQVRGAGAHAGVGHLAVENFFYLVEELAVERAGEVVVGHFARRRYERLAEFAAAVDDIAYAEFQHCHVERLHDIVVGAGFEAVYDILAL